jgi:tetratricopeptide (TPR) repeat protein
MPRLAANDVPHTSQTDHRVLRIPMETVPSVTGKVVAIFREEAGIIPDAELERARALFLVREAGRANNPAMALDAVAPLEDWLERAPDDLAAIEALGIALEMGREINAAVAVWERGLELDPNHEDILRRLMFVCHDHGQTDLGIEYARRLVALNPWYHDYWGRLAHMLGQQGEFEEGIQAAVRALEILPSNGAIRGWLVEAYQEVGDEERAAEQLRIYNLLMGSE